MKPKQPNTEEKIAKIKDTVTKEIAKIKEVAKIKESAKIKETAKIKEEPWNAVPLRRPNLVDKSSDSIDTSMDVTLNTTATDQEWKEKVDAMIEKDGNVWRCIECDKVAESPKHHWNLKGHVETHLAGVVHNCTLCGHPSRTSKGLIQHKYKKHKVEMQIMGTRDWEFKCKFCHQGSRSKGGLLQHISKNHPNSNTKTEGKYKCGVCGKGSKTSKGRLSHKYKYHRGEGNESKVMNISATESEEEHDEVKVKEENGVDEQERFKEDNTREKTIEKVTTFVEEHTAVDDISVQVKKIEDEVKMLKLRANRFSLTSESDLDTSSEPLSEKTPSERNSNLEPRNKNVQNYPSTVEPWNTNTPSGTSSMGLAELQEKVMSLCRKDGDIWTCTACGKEAENIRRHNLFQHVEMHIEGIALACDECGKVSRSSKGLYQHKAKNHARRDIVSKYNCGACGKGSKTRKGLESHTYKYHKSGAYDRAD